jgi:predicted dinucleotide-binding enzyme
MKIGIIGAGNIGGNAARLWSRAGHQVLVSFSRDPSSLEALAQELGNHARSGTPGEAVEFGDVVMLSAPWSVIPLSLEQAGSLDGKVVIDTTNQFGRGVVEMPPNGMSAAEFNARRMPGARPVKSYNTLTAGFQAAVAGRTGADRVAMFYAGEDEEAKRVVAGLIADSGFAPVDIGGWAQVRLMEAPRRPGAVYGEAYHPDEAREIASAAQTEVKRAGELAERYRIAE